MIRKTLTVFSFLGLLLSVGLWIAPYWFGLQGGSIGIGVNMGTLEFRHFSEPQAWRVQGGWQGWRPITVLPHRGSLHNVFGDFGSYVAVPLWIPAATLGVVWLFFLSPVSRRKKLGLCVKCGYSLKGLTEPRCPECNTPFEKS